MNVKPLPDPKLMKTTYSNSISKGMHIHLYIFIYIRSTRIDGPIISGCGSNDILIGM